MVKVATLIYCLPPLRLKEWKPLYRRILLIRLRQLGDSLLVTPALRQLRQLYPNAQIDVLCEPGNDCIFANHPAVNERMHLRRGESARKFLSLAAQLRKRHYDLIVDFQGLPKTAVLTRLIGGKKRLGVKRRWVRNRLTYTDPFESDEVFPDYAAVQHLKLLQNSQINLSDRQLDFYLSDTDWEFGKRFAAEQFCRPIVAFYPTGRIDRLDQRFWSVQKFAEVGDWLVEQGFQILMVFGPGKEIELVHQVQANMKHPSIANYPVVSFAQLRAIFEHCQLFVGSDGGPKHVAVSAGLPTVTMFGEIDPDRWNDGSDPKQRLVATAETTRSQPTKSACTQYLSIPEIPAELVIAQVQSLIEAGLVESPKCSSTSGFAEPSRCKSRTE